MILNEYKDIFDNFIDSLDLKPLKILHLNCQK